MSYYLSDYTSIGNNEILKMKLAGKEGYLYGSIGSVSMPPRGTGPSTNATSDKAIAGTFQQFLNYEECLADEFAVPAFRRLPIKTSDIESIEIIVDEVFGS